MKKLLLLLFGVLFIPTMARAQWNPNPTNNVIAAADFSQKNQKMIPDGSGGAIIVWEDDRNTNTMNTDLYAQRINANGVVQWTLNGVAISNYSGQDWVPQLISDGNNGAIITWQRDGDIYAQRINAGGTVQWTAGGVPVCTATSTQNFPQLVSDGNGGAIVTWEDNRGGIFPPNGPDIYAQKINAAGAPQWPANGVAIAAAGLSQLGPQLVSDNSGGAIITWVDSRSGTTVTDIYAQRVNAGGVVQWPANGVPVCGAANGQYLPKIVTDGSNGAIIVWEDNRSGNYDIYAQRVNSGGTMQWTSNGVAVCNAGNNQEKSHMVSDGSGGAYLVWEDRRNHIASPNNYYFSDIYLQRINASGVAQWAANGLVICNQLGYQTLPKLTADGTTGVIVAWADAREYYDTGLYPDIYAQKVNTAGIIQGISDGNPVCSAVNAQTTPELVSDASGGSIITWADLRNGNSYDIYASPASFAPTCSASAPTSVSPTSQDVCAGESVTLSASCAAGYTVQWYEGTTLLGTGSPLAYSVTSNVSIYVSCKNNACESEPDTINLTLSNYLSYAFIGGDLNNDAVLTFHGCPSGTVNWRVYQSEYSDDNGPVFTLKDSITGNPATMTLKGVYRLSATCSNSTCAAPPAPIEVYNCYWIYHTLLSPNDNYNQGLHIIQSSYGGTIEATNKVMGTSRMWYEAQSIELKPGFEVNAKPNGAVFTAKPGGCLGS